MTWTQTESPALNFSLEREPPENSEILYSIRWLWGSVAQLVAFVQALHKVLGIFLFPSKDRLRAVCLLVPTYVLQDLSRIFATIRKSAYPLILRWNGFIEDTQNCTRQRWLAFLWRAVQAIYESISAFLLSFTMCRFYAVCILLPVYISQQLYRRLPTIPRNFRCLISRWNKLIGDTEAYRRQGSVQAQLQLEGKYIFPETEVIRVNLSGKMWINGISWHDNVEEFVVCGARVRYIHLRPTANGAANGSYSRKRPIVFLHGNRGWSYMWRKVMAKLLLEGHEIFALDWLGHGLSDKPVQRDAMTFELHIRTLTAFVNHVDLDNAILVAHHWGGCVALSAIPSLPSSSFSGLFLINSFLPPRPREISIHCHLLHAVWFLLTAVLDGYASQSSIARFISPHISERDVECYEAPYQDLPAATRSSAERFSRHAPGIPHFILRRARETQGWKLCEGILGPRNFSDLNALALLSERDDFVRSYWKSKREEDLDEGMGSKLKTVIAFGARDPLLKDYKDVLVRVVGKNNMVDWAPDGIWLPNAGHYPMEDSPDDIAQLIARLC